MTSPIPSQLVAEFLGTFLLVFTVGCNVLSNNPVWGGVSIACVLMVMIYSFGKISGGNFNPAVSLALGIANSMGCRRGKDWKEVGLFIVVQIVAGILAGFCYYALFGHAFHLGAATGSSFIPAALCELLYTCILCFVVLNVAAVGNENYYYGLAIGAVVIAGAYGAGAVSGGCFNPAVAIGIDIVGGYNLGIGWAIIYVICELVGAALAVVLFFLVRPTAFNKKADSLRSVLLAEFLGTYVLVLTIGLNVLGRSQAAAVSIAASLLCMIYSLGDISQAHFNPAVTLAVHCFMRNRTPKEVALYMIAQILGAIVAGFTYVSIYERRSFPLGPAQGFGWAEVVVAEIMYTFVLCLVVLCVVVSPLTRGSEMFGLAIASCIMAGVVAIGSISGGSLNPAVSIGIASSQILSHTMHSTLGQLWRALIYSVLEFIGALLAVGALSITHKSENRSTRSPPSQLAAEFIGTFLLVFTIGCNVLGSKTPSWAGVSIGSILMVMIYAFGNISGAHFNPAVSLTQGIVRQIGGRDGAGQPLGMSWKGVALFASVQTVAGILAGFCYYAVFNHSFNLAPTFGVSMLSAGVAELLYTFMLCFVVLNVTLTDNSYFGLAIGFVVVAGSYGAGAISGGCFNPAVAIGIDVIGGRSHEIGWAIIYVIFEIAGAVLAVACFRIVRANCFGDRNNTLVPKLFSEFLGAFMLVLTVGLNVMGNSTAGAFSVAASLMCMIYALSDVSGAHFNPAVTLAIFISEGRPKNKAKEYVFYMVSQVLGGICAAWTYLAMYNWRGFRLGPAQGFGWTATMVAEFVFTFVLCLVVLCVAVKSPSMDGPKANSKPPFFGLAIGSCIAVGGFAIGKISGGSLNPAVSFGIASTHFFNGGLWSAVLYSLAEFIGAAVAAVVVGFTHDRLAGAGYLKASPGGYGASYTTLGGTSSLTGSRPLMPSTASYTVQSPPSLMQPTTGLMQPTTIPPTSSYPFRM